MVSGGQYAVTTACSPSRSRRESHEASGPGGSRGGELGSSPGGFQPGISSMPYGLKRAARGVAPEEQVSSPCGPDGANGGVLGGTPAALVLLEPVSSMQPKQALRTIGPVKVKRSGQRCLASAKAPADFKDANTKECWRQVMEEELRSIHDNNIWELVDLPDNEKVMDLKWEFMIKKDADGSVKHKARLVAKEYVQEEGVDFEEVFVPVAKMESVRLLIALAVQESWKIHHMDVKSAFLNGELEGDVYVNQSPGFIKEGEEHKVLKLHKVLYGLRQGSREWNIKLDRTLISLGFEKAPLEHAMYKRGEGRDRLLVGIYVDDLLITGADEKVITKFKLQMKELSRWMI